MDVNIFGQSPKEMTQYIPDVESDPYVELINAVFEGARNMFTSTDLLLASWNLWTPVLHFSEGHLPRQYVGRGRDSERLDFIVTSRGLQWQLNDRDEVSYETSAEFDANPIYGQIPTNFRNSTLVSGSTKSVVAALASRISSLADSARISGNEFHLALSGGASAAAILEQLAETVLTWDHIHVWMVDERCVHPTSSQSNYNLIQRHLLNNVQIAHWNVHPMLTKTESCDTDAVDSADILYEDAINRLVPDSKFDFVILGVGDDGHTASLFPNQASLDEEKRLVSLSVTGKPDGEVIRSRVTLTFTTINKAKDVAILTLGEAKNAILKTIAEISDVRKFPVTGVKPSNGLLTWYIDYEALFGKN